MQELKLVLTTTYTCYTNFGSNIKKSVIHGAGITNARLKDDKTKKKVSKFINLVSCDVVILNNLQVM